MAKLTSVDDVTWEEKPARSFRRKRKIYGGAMAVVLTAGVAAFLYARTHERPLEVLPVPMPLEEKVVLSKSKRLPWCEMLKRNSGEFDLLVGPAARAYCGIR